MRQTLPFAQEIELHLAPEANNRFIRITRMPGQVVYLSGPPADGSFNRFDVAARLPSGRTQAGGNTQSERRQPDER